MTGAEYKSTFLKCTAMDGLYCHQRAIIYLSIFWSHKKDLFYSLIKPKEQSKCTILLYSKDTLSNIM